MQADAANAMVLTVVVQVVEVPVQTSGMDFTMTLCGENASEA